MGIFINTIPLRVTLKDKEQTLEERLRELQDSNNKSSAHDHAALGEMKVGKRGASDYVKHLFVFENYPDVRVKTAEGVREQLSVEMIRVEEAVKEYFPDAPDLLYFRPPEGDVDEWLIRAAAQLGYRTVLWSFAYSDYRTESQPTYEEGIEAVKRGLQPGCVYLLHAESFTNADILAEFIDWVRSQAYDILPLCDIRA